MNTSHEEFERERDALLEKGWSDDASVFSTKELAYFGVGILNPFIFCVAATCFFAGILPEESLRDWGMKGVVTGLLINMLIASITGGLNEREVYNPRAGEHVLFRRPPHLILIGTAVALIAAIALAFAASLLLALWWGILHGLWPVLVWLGAKAAAFGMLFVHGAENILQKL